MYTKKNNEKFLGNHQFEKFENGRFVKNEFPGEGLECLKTLRLGEQAYDIDGNPLSKDYYLPVFINVSELGLYDKIMTDRIRKIRGYGN